jgi:hypothetical protein
LRLELKKSLLAFLIAATMVGGLAFVGSIYFGTVHASTNVIGIITSDSTWTKAGSPYTLTGPVGVSNGVTLIIEAGTTVNLNNYYITVNGTLRAVGNNADKIQINGGEIVFSQSSSSWNEQTGSGSIIENAILTSDSTAIEIWNMSPKINRNSIVGSIFAHGASPYIPGGTEAVPIISNNIIRKSGYNVAIQSSVSPSITNNTIRGGIISGGHGSTVISNNIIEGDGEYGIEAGSVPDYISNNIISGFDIGIGAHISTIIERNIIVNNQNGILMNINANPVIRYNTIVNNSNGINLPGYAPPNIGYHNIQVTYNNIQENSNYNIYLGPNARYDVNASYNWWGTTDTQAISQKIHDSKDDFNLGTVTFEPFLTEPNPAAVPSASPGIPEFPTSIILALLVTATLAMAVASKRKTRSKLPAKQPAFTIVASTNQA